MKISIIMPMYNAESNLDEAIQSVINQKEAEYELIIVNDGSTDDSEKIVCKYKLNNSNIKLIDIKNQGVSNARNIGLLNSTGDYITFLDSDDYFSDNLYLSRIGDYLEKHPCDILLNPFYIFEKKIKNNYPRKENCIFNLEMKRDFQMSLFTFQSSYFTNVSFNGYVFGKFFSKTIANQICFNTNISIREDALFVFDAFEKSNTIHFTNDYGYVYVLSKNSTMGKFKPYFEDECLAFCSNIKSRIFDLDNNNYYRSVLYCYMTWLKMDLFHRKANYKKNIIKETLLKSFNNDKWFEAFKNINYSNLSLSYKLLKFIYLRRSILLIKLIVKLNKFIRR